MKPRTTEKNTLSKIIFFFVSLWLFCIGAFVVLIIFGTGFFHGTIQNTALGKSQLFTNLLIGTFGIGVLAFLMIMVLVIAGLAHSHKLVVFEKTFWGAIVYIPKFFLFLITAPLFIVTKILIDKSKKLSQKIFPIFLVLVMLTPIWVGGYWLLTQFGLEYLGYTSQDMNILGTGSMYPTWPKGDIGKSQKELSKQIVASAGFIPYPNGISFNGNRYFNYQINRGDIVSFENKATDEITKKMSEDPGSFVKRVIAMAGDTLEIRDGIVYLNDSPIREPYIAQAHSTFGEDFLNECQKITVPDGSVFVMGDNRMGSADSREIGFVKLSEIHFVIPLKNQKGNLDKNWHDTTNDLDSSSKPKIDPNEFVNLLNSERQKNGADAIKLDTKLSLSAELRGKAILRYDDFSPEATRSGYPMEKSMSDAGYWNPYWWEINIQGYYDAKSLIESYLERETSDAKNVWYDKKFDDLGVAQVEGTVNGCPTQVIVIQSAGYIPATYRPEDVQSWRDAINNLNTIIPSWENGKGQKWINQDELSHLLDLLYRERVIAKNILAKEEARLWLSKPDYASIDEYNKISNESAALANKLNGK